MKKIHTPLHRRLESFRRQTLPIIIWSAAVIGVVQLLYLRGSTTMFRGIAEAAEHFVTAPADGKLREITVNLYQEVMAGQVVARMASESLEAQIRTASAIVQQLGAEQLAVISEIEAAGDQLSWEWGGEARRFQMDIVNIQIELLQARVDLETKRVEAERRKVDYQRAKALPEIVSDAVTQDLLLAYQEVRETILNTEAFLAVLEDDQQQAENRYRNYLASTPEPPKISPRMEAFRRAVDVQELRVEEIILSRVALIVRAPVSGRIQSLEATLGQNLVLGQAILSVVPDHGQTVVFYQPADHASDLQVGDRVLVRHPGNLLAMDAQVAILSPAIEQLPAAMWRDPSMPEYGRAARLSPVPDLNLIPGHQVQVSLVSN